MLKKILGTIFFLFGILFVLSFIGNVVSLIIGRKGANSIETIEVITGIIFTIVFGYIFFKYAFKWTSKKIAVEEIEDIGK